jgi:hypothetical protein
MGFPLIKQPCSPLNTSLLVLLIMENGTTHARFLGSVDMLSLMY